MNEDVSQAIKTEALKNDVKLIALPLEGDTISVNDFAEVYPYINITSAKAEKIGLIWYSCIMDTSIGEMRVNFKNLDELQNFATTHKISVNEVINTPKNIMYCTFFVMTFVFIAVLTGLLLKSTILEYSSDIEGIIFFVSLFGFLVCVTVGLCISPL